MGVELSAAEIDASPAAMKDLGLGRILGRGDEAGEIAVGVDVVGVEKEEEWAARALDPGIAGHGQAAPRLEHADDPSGVAGKHRRGRVGRTVVDDDDLSLDAALRQRAVDRPVDAVFAVVDWDDDTDVRSRHHRCPSLSGLSAVEYLAVAGWSQGDSELAGRMIVNPGQW